MKPHTKIYLKSIGKLGDSSSQLVADCEICGQPCQDVHHIRGRKIIEPNALTNLIGLCRNCHSMAHNLMYLPAELEEIARKRIENANNNH